MREMNQDINPLVSIIVITYNSAKFVLETLESAKAQTYQNIELIISDDCSSDNTIEICREWLKENKDRFVNTELITVEKNTGIPANCNRGVKASKGEWIKTIAGDDLLLENALEDLISSVHNSDLIVDTGYIEFKGNREYLKKVSLENESFFDFDSKSQFEILINNNRKKRVITTVGVFFKRKLFNEVNGFDEEIKLLEDTPFWFKILKQRVRIKRINTFTVLYRKHVDSISANNKNGKIISPFQESLNLFTKKYLLEELNGITKLNELWLVFWADVIVKLGNKGFLLHWLHNITFSLQPLRFHNLFKKMF
jgi:alpha-1,3-rhamnosyltransferase